MDPLSPSFANSVRDLLFGLDAGSDVFESDARGVLVAPGGPMIPPLIDELRLLLPDKNPFRCCVEVEGAIVETLEGATDVTE